jgi:hypothetical protein
MSFSGSNLQSSKVFFKLEIDGIFIRKSRKSCSYVDKDVFHGICRENPI